MFLIYVSLHYKTLELWNSVSHILEIINPLKFICVFDDVFYWILRNWVIEYYEVSASRVHPWCANAHNCLGLKLGR